MKQGRFTDEQIVRILRETDQDSVAEVATQIHTTRSPLRIDGERPLGARAAPRVGEHSAQVRAEFKLHSATIRENVT